MALLRHADYARGAAVKAALKSFCGFNDLLPNAVSRANRADRDRAGRSFYSTTEVSLKPPTRQATQNTPPELAMWRILNQA